MYDVIVVGGGPAGLTAMLYLLRARIKAVLVEKAQLGGQIVYSEVIENYPGVGHVSGKALITSFTDQLAVYQPEIIRDTVTRIRQVGSHFDVDLQDRVLTGRAVILTTGAQPKMLGVNGEQQFTGRGVSYCATCDAPLYQDRQIVVVGGGDTAVKEALFLTKYVSKIYLIHRRDALRAEKIYQEKLLASDKVTVLWNCILSEIQGDNVVKSVTIKDLKTGMFSTFNTEGVFVFVGIEPNVIPVDCEKAEDGFVRVDADMATDVPGLYAAGDIRVTGLRQVTTAVGDGARAAMSAQHFLEAQ